MATQQTPPSGQDPSANVLMLVGNAVKYLEQLHFEDVRNTIEMRDQAVNESRRERAAEAERINALRAVDIAAVGLANERAVKQAEVLASQLALSAETLRTLVAQTASNIAQQLQAVTGQLVERIAALEKVQYENQGKNAEPSPLVTRLDALEECMAENKGQTTGKSQLWMLITSVILFLISVAGFIISLTH